MKTTEYRKQVILEKIVESKSGKDYIPTKEEIENSNCFIKQVDLEKGIITIGYKNNIPYIIEQYSKANEKCKHIYDLEIIEKAIKQLGM